MTSNETLRTNLLYINNMAPGNNFKALHALSFYRYQLDNDNPLAIQFKQWYKNYKNGAIN